MGEGFLIDTNIVISVLNDLLPPEGKSFVATLPPINSEITRIELLGWPNATPAQLDPVQAFIEKAILLPINEAVIQRTIAIRQSKKNQTRRCYHCRHSFGVQLHHPYQKRGRLQKYSGHYSQ